MCSLLGKINLASSPLDDQPLCSTKTTQTSLIIAVRALAPVEYFKIGSNILSIYTECIYPVLLPEGHMEAQLKMIWNLLCEERGEREECRPSLAIQVEFYFEYMIFFLGQKIMLYHICKLIKIKIRIALNIFVCQDKIFLRC